MKKSFILISSLFCFITTAFAEIRSEPCNYNVNIGPQVVISENTNLYSSASSSSPVLFTPEVGETIQIISVPNNGWCKIKYNNKTVYASLDDLSDYYSPATFFDNPGSYATKTYNLEILLPYSIPSKSYTKVRKSLSPEDQKLLDNFYRIDNGVKAKPYVMRYFSITDSINNYPDLSEIFKFHDLVWKLFPEETDDYQKIEVPQLDIYATYTYEGTTKVEKKTLYSWDLENLQTYTSDFDGNTLLGFNGRENPYDDGTINYFSMWTVTKEPYTAPALNEVLYERTRIIVAGQNDEYKLTMPADFKGVRNQIHFVLKGDFPEDFLYIYKNNHFLKQSNFGIINKKSVTFRNKPSLDGAKITGTIREGTTVTVYGIKGSGKIIGNTLDLWYKIAEYEEKYVNATAINLFPFCLSGYNWEQKEVTVNKASGARYVYDELYFDISNNSTEAIRAENIEWMDKNSTTVQQFADDFWNTILDRTTVKYFEVTDSSTPLPMGIKLGITSENVIRQIFGLPVWVTNDGSTLTYDTILFEDYVLCITFEFDNGVLSKVIWDNN